MATKTSERPTNLRVANLNVDSILFLQRLLDLHEFPEVLGLMGGNVYYQQDQERVDDVTVKALWEAGFIDLDGNVDPALKRWLTVLAQSDIYVACRGMEEHRMRRAVVARMGDINVLAARRGDALTVQRIWSGSKKLEDTVCAPLWAAILPTQDGPAPEPAKMPSIMMSLDDITKIAEGKPGQVVRALCRKGVELRAARILNEASEYKGQRVEIVACHNRGVEYVATKAAVMVADTSFGRVIFDPRKHGHEIVGTFGPGTLARFHSAIANLVKMTPSGDWFSARPA